MTRERTPLDQEMIRVVRGRRDRARATPLGGCGVVNIAATIVTPSVADLDALIDGTDTHDGHVGCCRVEQFACGAPFHPESEIDDDADAEDACADCARVVAYYTRPAHSHCFADETRPICPAKKDRS